MATKMMTQAEPACTRTSAEAEAEAFEKEAEVALLRAEAVRLRAAEDARRRTLAIAVAPDVPRLVTASELARRLDVSVATVRRLDPPHEIVGDKSTRRYDVDTVRAWLRDREPAPTTPKKREAADADVDIGPSLAKASMRPKRSA